MTSVAMMGRRLSGTGAAGLAQQKQQQQQQQQEEKTPGQRAYEKWLRRKREQRRLERQRAAEEAQKNQKPTLKEKQAMNERSFQKWLMHKHDRQRKQQRQDLERSASAAATGSDIGASQRAYEKWLRRKDEEQLQRRRHTWHSTRHEKAQKDQKKALAAREYERWCITKQERVKQQRQEQRMNLRKSRELLARQEEERAQHNVANVQRWEAHKQAHHATARREQRQQQEAILAQADTLPAPTAVIDEVVAQWQTERAQRTLSRHTHLLAQSRSISSTKSRNLARQLPSFSSERRAVSWTRSQRQ